MSKKEIFDPDVVCIRILGYPSGHGWKEISKSALRKIETAQQICVTRESRSLHGTEHSSLYTTWRPPRRRNESPIQYRKRTKCVDDNFTARYKGHYYCNPAHCKLRWKSKAKRDEHMASAYGILG
jgi:hypothetical protein